MAFGCSSVKISAMAGVASLVCGVSSQELPPNRSLCAQMPPTYCGKCIGFLNDLFYGLDISHDRQSCQFLFCLMKIHCCTGPLGRRAVGRQAKGFLWRRSVELRASGAVGLRWQAAFGSSDRLE